MNKKKKSTNTSSYPDEVIDRLARAFYPAILACWNSEEGQRSLVRPSILLTQDRSVAQKPHWGFCCCANASLPWQAEQAHHAPSKEKQSVPDGNALLYISLSYVDFGRVRPIQGRTLFFVLPYFTLFRSSFFVAHRL